MRQPEVAIIAAVAGDAVVDEQDREAGVPGCGPGGVQDQHPVRKRRIEIGQGGRAGGGDEGRQAGHGRCNRTMAATDLILGTLTRFRADRKSAQGSRTGHGWARAYRANGPGHDAWLDRISTQRKREGRGGPQSGTSAQPRMTSVGSPLADNMVPACLRAPIVLAGPRKVMVRPGRLSGVRSGRGELAAPEDPIQRHGFRLVERRGAAANHLHLGQRLLHRRPLVDRLHPARDVRELRRGLGADAASGRCAATGRWRCRPPSIRTRPDTPPRRGAGRSPSQTRLAWVR